MTKLVRVIDAKRCMGCRSCVAACHVENHLTPESPWNVMMERESGEFPNVNRTFTTMNCMHCEHPACMEACNAVGAKAITKNELGVVLIDYDKCIGCQYCNAVCPYGVPQYTDKVRNLYPDAEKTPYEQVADKNRHPTHRKKEKTMQKCTFCWHKLEKAVEAGETHLIGQKPEYTPSCDLVCPVDARVFGDIDDPNSTVSQWVGTKKATQIKKEFGTRPQVYYVLDGGE